MALKGKGFFIWKIPSVEGGNPGMIAKLAKEANFSHVLIKIADGTGRYNIDPDGVDLVPAVVEALRGVGIQAWGWHYVYGYNPVGEANIAVQRVKQLRLDGYVIDAEAQYKEPGKARAARDFMTRLRNGIPNTPIALSSYRYPSYHPQLPWKEFLEKCDYNMPQVYWLLNHNPGYQLTRCVREFEELAPYRPIIPTGAAYKSGAWSPSTGDIVEFMKTAQKLDLSAANFYEWSNCRLYLPHLWETVADYSWPFTPPRPDITQEYISALNSHDPGKVLSLYLSNGVHVTGSRTIQGAAALRDWYISLFKKLLPNAKFTLTRQLGSGNSRYMNWTATSSASKVLDGSDTLGLVDGKIAYHFNYFTITHN